MTNTLHRLAEATRAQLSLALPQELPPEERQETAAALARLTSDLNAWLEINDRQQALLLAMQKHATLDPVEAPATEGNAS